MGLEELGKVKLWGLQDLGLSDVDVVQGVNTLYVNDHSHHGKERNTPWWPSQSLVQWTREQTSERAP